MPNLYGDRNAGRLDSHGGHYTRHFWALEREGLSLDRATVAAELAYRDMLIEGLQVKLLLAGESIKPKGQKAQVLDALRCAAKPLSILEIGHLTGLTYGHVKSVIQQAKRQFGDRLIVVVTNTRPRQYKSGHLLKHQSES